MPMLGNPAGLWALLGLPTILAIHFLQQRSRRVVTSTWFLIENLAPDSARGRTWERLRSSWTLWCQLLAVLAAAWVLAEPRWVRAESAQTVVIVLDASASMDAFRRPALAVAEREIAAAAGLAAQTTWVVMTSDLRQPALYRGLTRLDAELALTRWSPQLGQHDLMPALRLARTLAGESGRSLLITDERGKVPAGYRAEGVGQVVDNVGFAGANVVREDSSTVWHAFVQNRSAGPQKRAWHVETVAGNTPEQSVELAAGALVEITGKFPEGANALTVVLAADAFAADDRLPLVRPQPKPLRVHVDGEDDAATFFKNTSSEVEGITLVGDKEPATLRLARIAATPLAAELHCGVFWPPANKREGQSLVADPLTPERETLVSGLNWQGWIGTGPYGYPATASDHALLWQGGRPLIFIRQAVAVAGQPTPGRKLMLGFDWDSSNAARLPATVLLVRRFLEEERDAQRAPYTANFDCGAPIALTGFPLDGAYMMDFTPAAGGQPEVRAIPPEERGTLRAPGRAGFFTLRRDEEVLVRGAAHFADARESDFSRAETFTIEEPGVQKAAIERNTRPDPFVIVWLLALVALVLGSWWVRQRRVNTAPKTQTARRTAGAPAA